MTLWNGVSIDFPKLLDYLGVPWWSPAIFLVLWLAVIIAFRGELWIRIVWLPGVLLLLPFPLFCMFAVGSLFTPGPPGPAAPGMGVLLLVPLYLSPFLVSLGIALWFRPQSDVLTPRFMIGSTVAMLVILVVAVEVPTRRAEQDFHIIVFDSTGRPVADASFSGEYSSADDAIISRRSFFAATTDSSGKAVIRIWPFAHFTAQASHPEFGAADLLASVEQSSRHTLRVSQSWRLQQPLMHQSLHRLVPVSGFRRAEFYLMPPDDFVVMPPFRELDELFRSDPEQALALAYSPGGGTAVPVLWHLDSYEQLLAQHKASPELADAAIRLIQALREECGKLPKSDGGRSWQNYQIDTLGNLNRLCQVEPPSGQDRLTQCAILDQKLRNWHRRLHALDAESRLR